MTLAPSLSGPAAITRCPSAERSKAFLFCKRCIQAAFWLLIAPRLAGYFLFRALMGRRAFGAASESIARLPGLRGVYCRQAFYRQTLAGCGHDAYFGWHSVFSMPEAVVGQRTYIGRFCSIGFAHIGDEAMLADHVQVLSGGHEHTRDDPTKSLHAQDQCFARTHIGAGAWIGAGAIVMADVGEHSVIGAGAVVNKPIPPYSVAVGVPARVVKSLPAPRTTASDVPST
jgi:virginiamycin A acetyltransferase